MKITNEKIWKKLLMHVRPAANPSPGPSLGVASQALAESVYRV